QDGPVVLATDPAPGAVLNSAPLVIRVELSAPLDPSTVVPGTNVRLIYSRDGMFDDATDVPLALCNVGAGGYELQLMPTTPMMHGVPGSPLKPGSYEIFLTGAQDANTGLPGLAGLDGAPLGGNSSDPASGTDFSSTFKVDGVEGHLVTDPL